MVIWINTHIIPIQAIIIVLWSNVNILKDIIVFKGYPYHKINQSDV